MEALAETEDVVPGGHGDRLPPEQYKPAEHAKHEDTITAFGFDVIPSGQAIGVPPGQ